MKRKNNKITPITSELTSTQSEQHITDTQSPSLQNKRVSFNSASPQVIEPEPEDEDESEIIASQPAKKPLSTATEAMVISSRDSQQMKLSVLYANTKDLITDSNFIPLLLKAADEKKTRFVIATLDTDNANCCFGDTPNLDAIKKIANKLIRDETVQGILSRIQDKRLTGAHLVVVPQRIDQADFLTISVEWRITAEPVKRPCVLV